jgi:hypothetical protein
MAVFLSATLQRVQSLLRESGHAESPANWCDLAINCGIFYSRMNLELQMITLKTHIILNLCSNKIRSNFQYKFSANMK